LSPTVQIVTAAVSVSGALYVGWRNRVFTKEMTTWQRELSDAVLCEQLCLATAGRARHVGERAGEAARSLTYWTSTRSTARGGVIERKLVMLDGAFDSLLEAWSDLSGRELTTAEMTRVIDRLGNELEVLRLQVAVDPDDTPRHVESLHTVARVARELATECNTMSARFGWLS
jgi:hypothetical protein